LNRKANEKGKSDRETSEVWQSCSVLLSVLFGLAHLQLVLHSCFPYLTGISIHLCLHKVSMEILYFVSECGIISIAQTDKSGLADEFPELSLFFTAF
jgi:hypothetical protein